MESRYKSITSALKQAFNKENVSVQDLQPIIIEAAKTKRLASILRFYYKCQDKPLQAALLRRALVWTLSIQVNKGEYRRFFLQPVIAYYLNFTKPFVPEVPSKIAQLALKQAYNCSGQITTSGILISPTSINIKDPSLPFVLPTAQIKLPIYPEQAGAHFRFFAVWLKDKLPIKDLTGIKDAQPIKDAVKNYTNAEKVLVLQPIEYFDVWLTFNSLNSFSLEDEGG